MARITDGWTIAAITFASPPHTGHTRTSDSNTRAINFAQGKYRGRKKEPAACDGGAGSGAAGVGGSERSRITAARHFDPPPTLSLALRQQS
jgi:hypothetical protein